MRCPVTAHGSVRTTLTRSQGRASLRPDGPLNSTSRPVSTRRPRRGRGLTQRHKRIPPHRSDHRSLLLTSRIGRHGAVYLPRCRKSQTFVSIVPSPLPLAVTQVVASALLPTSKKPGLRRGRPALGPAHRGAGRCRFTSGYLSLRCVRWSRARPALSFQISDWRPENIPNPCEQHSDVQLAAAPSALRSRATLRTGDRCWCEAASTPA